MRNFRIKIEGGKEQVFKGTKVPDIIQSMDTETGETTHWVFTKVEFDQVTDLITSVKNYIHVYKLATVGYVNDIQDTAG